MSGTIERTLSATGTAGSAATATATLTRSPRKTDFVTVSVYVKSSTVEVTGVAWGNGTFTRAHRQVGATTAVETWIGYGFDGSTVDTTLTVTLGAATHASAHVQVFSNGAEHTVAPVVSGGTGATGTGGTADPGGATPAADDESQLVHAVLAHAATGALTTTSTPGGMEGIATGANAATPVQNHVSLIGRRAASSTSLHNLTAPATNEWVAQIMIITPSASTPSADTVQVYKGRLTSTLDNAAVA